MLTETVPAAAADANEAARAEFASTDTGREKDCECEADKVLLPAGTGVVSEELEGDCDARDEAGSKTSQ